MLKETRAIRWFKSGLWAVAFSGLVAGIGRFAFGLGAATNMMDSLPWGWWKIFNMVGGAALATSGFIVAAIIYILQWDRYRSIARLSVLIGFLGYGSSLFSLLFDIGLPHRGWHPFFMWNPHSFLFEVFWCVSVYWAVTALELIPILTERMPFPKVTHWLHEKILPVVVLGITLSTMHHSSLGSLFMTSPTRLHPLWHSYWIPPEYFISAMGAGLATIVLLMLATSHLYGRQRDQKALNGLALGSAVFLGLYLAVKIADFTFNDKWSFVFGPDLTWESSVFWVEITLQAIIPVVFLSIRRLRRNEITLTIGALSAFVGLIMHRLDTGIVGYFRTSEAIYVPSVSEFLVSFGVLAAAGLVFFFLIERFYVLEDRDPADSGKHPKVRLWSLREALAILRGPGVMRAAGIFLVVAPVTFIALRDQATGSFKPVPQPVTAQVAKVDADGKVFRIDANENGMSTDFTHAKHHQELAKAYKVEPKQICTKCHHLDLPKEREEHTACRACHRDMENPTPIHDPARHRSRFETEEALAAFQDVDPGDRRATFGACMGCHKDNMPGLAAYAGRGFDMRAPGFKHAMHGNCLTCHRLRERVLEDQDPRSPSSTGNCLFCHRQWADEGVFADEPLSGI